MDKHKSNIMELMECLDSIDKTDFQEMSRKFKNDSLLLSGSAMTFGTVFLLLELIKEIKEIKNFLYDKNNSKGKSDINPVINISTSLKEENLKVSIDDMEYFDNKALYQFTIPTKSKAQRD